jgi:UDP-N-acetylglucosamine--N-acetylmuramyl-(pentapeptide) pyrophosphoryl-undecaprenol N-acetylglucosamine transferase
VIHEQNAVMGRANRLLAGRVTAVACAFPTLQKASARVKARAVVVGNPLRPEIRALYDKPYKAPGETVRILVTGGSQGARILSEMVPDGVAMLAEPLRLKLRVEQQTRMESLEFARTTYAEAGVEAEVAPFFRNMAARLEAAHLVIGRAGSSTVCELAAAGRPAILVPLGIALDDDQGQNARLLVEARAAEVIPEPELSAERLCETLSRLIADPEELVRRAAAARSVAKPDAAEALADLVEKTVG